MGDGGFSEGCESSSGEVRVYCRLARTDASALLGAFIHYWSSLSLQSTVIARGSSPSSTVKFRT